jgi:hypothetical protein
MSQEVRKPQSKSKTQPPRVAIKEHVNIYYNIGVSINIIHCFYILYLYVYLLRKLYI